MAITMDQIKQLREQTGAGVMDAKKALEESKGDMKQAAAFIAKKGLARAEKKADRETAQGFVGSYVHHTGKAGAMVKLLCETDFVARTEDFRHLARELAMQVTSMQPETIEELMGQDYMREPSMTIEHLVKQTAAKVGENVVVGEMKRVEI